MSRRTNKRREYGASAADARAAAAARKMKRGDRV